MPTARCLSSGRARRDVRPRRRHADARPHDRILVVDADPAIEGPGVIVDTTVLGIYDHGYVTAVQRRPTPTTEGRLWHIRAGRIVLATGATERPIVFANDDRPGIMLAGAAVAYIERYSVRPGTRAVVFTTNDTTIRVEAALAAAGIEIAATVDARLGEVVVDTLADDDGRVAAVRVARLDDRGAVDPTTVRTVACDLLLVSGGWNPNVSLWSQARGTLRFDDAIARVRAGSAGSARSDRGRRGGGRGDRGARGRDADVGRAAAPPRGSTTR